MAEENLTPSERVKYFLLICDGLFLKDEARDKFVRRGMNRRQDHGSRGCREGHIWDDREGDFSMAAKRRDFRAAGRQIGQ